MSKEFTADEVAKHNTESDCWVIIDGSVYNLTEFLPDHPGGKKAILTFAGRDATEEFDMLHDRKVITKYVPKAKIGTVKKSKLNMDLSTPVPQVHTKDLGQALTFVGIDTILFSTLGYLAYWQFKKARADLRQPGGEAAPVSVAGGETRLLFMGMLSFSNFARAVTLCAEALTQQDHQLQRSVRTWVYYASVLVSFPLLKPIVVFINIAAYVVFAVIACLTLLLMAWTEFRQYLYFLLGALFMFCALNFFYYGVKVSAQLLDRNKQLSRKSRIIRRVVVLTATVPLILLVKGVYCAGMGLGFFSMTAPFKMSRLTWDCTNFFVTEFVPSVLMLLVFWPGSPRADAYEPPSSLLTSKEATSLESPLLEDRAEGSGEVRHPHLLEAQSRLELLSRETLMKDVQEDPRPKHVQAVGASRGLSTPTASPDIGPGDLFKPWNARKATYVLGV